MKTVKTADAVGHVLCHDITQIIKGVTKDAVFRKGHIVKEEDIPVLFSVGKDILYVWEKNEDYLHENEAAEILCAACHGEGMHKTLPKEGKIELIADIDGVLCIDTDKLIKINSLGEMMIATRNNFIPVKVGDKLAGTRIIPLVIEKSKISKVSDIAGGNPILSVLPYKHKKVGIVVTGNEVYRGRIKDTFSPVIKEKLSEFDVEILPHAIVDDTAENITMEIKNFISQGADMVVCTGGMSVDPSDMTPAAIRDTGAEIISYGAPVLPGAMFMLAYYDGKLPIVGLPGCVMYARRTIFDLILPRIMADVRISKEDLSKLGNGGLCLCCDNCTYPNCGFGKGV